MDREKLRASIDQLIALTRDKADYNQIVAKIKELVPEYIGNNNKTSDTY
jgi:hypothetical protein